MTETNENKASAKPADATNYKNRAQIKSDGVVNVSISTL